MNKRTYKLANKKKAQVEYGYKGGKWNFRIGNFTLMTKVPGGKENADRIAEILRKSWLRCKEVDGTARNAIQRIVNGEFKALKDYRGPFDHNWSWTDDRNQTAGEPCVNMVPPARQHCVETEGATFPVMVQPKNGFVTAANVIQEDALAVE